MENRHRAFVLITPLAIILILFFLLPIGSLAIYSFRGGTFYEAERSLFTLTNYIKLFHNTSILRVYGSTLIMAASVALFAVLLAYPVAYFLAFRCSSSNRVTYLTLMIVPAWTSYLLRIVAWKMMLGSDGVINSILRAIGISGETAPILLYSPQAVVVTLVYVWIPFAALPIFLVLDRLDRHLLEASADLGTPPWGTFLRITLPLSIPGIIASLLYVFIPTLGDYVTPMLVGGVKGGTYFGNVISNEFIMSLNWPSGATMSVFLVATILFTFLVFSRIIRFREIIKF